MGNSRNGTAGDFNWCRNTSSRPCHKRTSVIAKGQVALWDQAVRLAKAKSRLPQLKTVEVCISLYRQGQPISGRMLGAQFGLDTVSALLVPEVAQAHEFFANSGR